MIYKLERWYKQQTNEDNVAAEMAALMHGLGRLEGENEGRYEINILLTSYNVKYPLFLNRVISNPSYSL